MKRDYEVMPRSSFSRVAKDMQCQLWFPLPSENVVLLRSGLLKHLDQHAAALFPDPAAPTLKAPTQPIAVPQPIPPPAAEPISHDADTLREHSIRAAAAHPSAGAPQPVPAGHPAEALMSEATAPGADVAVSEQPVPSEMPSEAALGGNANVESVGLSMQPDVHMVDAGAGTGFAAGISSDGMLQGSNAELPPSGSASPPHVLDASDHLHVKETDDGIREALPQDRDPSGADSGMPETSRSLMQESDVPMREGPKASAEPQPARTINAAASQEISDNQLDRLEMEVGEEHQTGGSRDGQASMPLVASEDLQADLMETSPTAHSTQDDGTDPLIEPAPIGAVSDQATHSAAEIAAGGESMPSIDESAATQEHAASGPLPSVPDAAPILDAVSRPASLAAAPMDDKTAHAIGTDNPISSPASPTHADPLDVELLPVAVSCVALTATTDGGVSPAAAETMVEPLAQQLPDPAQLEEVVPDTAAIAVISAPEEPATAAHASHEDGRHDDPAAPADLPNSSNGLQPHPAQPPANATTDMHMSEAALAGDAAAQVASAEHAESAPLLAASPMSAHPGGAAPNEDNAQQIVESGVNAVGQTHALNQLPLSADAVALKEHWAQLKGQVCSLRPVERFTVVSIAYRRCILISSQTCLKRLNFNCVGPS